MTRQSRPELALLPTSPLLITESADEFSQLRGAFNDEMKPRGIIEHMFVADITHLTWEIMRLRRCKAGIINSAFRVALANLLGQLIRRPPAFRQNIFKRRNLRADGSPTRKTRSKF